MRHTCWMALAAAAALATGCASMNVSSHVERGIDFAMYQTYDWAPADALPTGDPRLDNNEFFQDYLTGAVEREMAVRGYRRATTGAPQLLLHYHASVTQRFEVHGLDRNYASCYPNCEPEMVEYEEGTIIVDVVDAGTNRLIWRGWAQDSVRGLLDDQDRMKRQVERSVERMFQRFPRGAVPADIPPDAR